MTFLLKVCCCVVQDELEEDVVVRVLDCDSISQVIIVFFKDIDSTNDFLQVKSKILDGQYTQLGKISVIMFSNNFLSCHQSEIFGIFSDDNRID